MTTQEIALIKVESSDAKYWFPPVSLEVPSQVAECLAADFESRDGVWHPLFVAAARISAATDYPTSPYGAGWSKAPSRPAGLSFSLPGGGGVGFLPVPNVFSGAPAYPSPGCNSFDLEICSFGDIVRAKVRVSHERGHITAEVLPAYQPRKRDLARARMWAAIAEGKNPREAAMGEGLGSNVGHAHAGFPPVTGEEDAIETAFRLMREGAALVRDQNQVIFAAGKRFLGLEGGE